MIDLNPLDVLKIRELNSLPPHFSKVRISSNENYDFKILDWIKSKLNGRYCITTYPSIDASNKFKTATFACFEEQKELTYFMLACPYLRRN
jgi:hypothetical protein